MTQISESNEIEVILFPLSEIESLSSGGSKRRKEGENYFDISDFRIIGSFQARIPFKIQNREIKGERNLQEIKEQIESNRETKIKMSFNTVEGASEEKNTMV